ncbi:MAG: metallophosphatase family protein [Coriobacteriales bacterium]|jgi:putative phosphoesterase|nr:metallophosphatase family protein [Coriobacteriales bacterium]
MAKKNSNTGPTKQLKGEWFKIGEDFYQQTWEQKFGGKNRHFQGGPAPTKLYLKNDKRISPAAFKEAKAIWQQLEQTKAPNAAPAIAATAQAQGRQVPQINVQINKPAGQPVTAEDRAQAEQMARRVQAQQQAQIVAQNMLIGVVSDTHGDIPDVALNNLVQNHVDHILHAGDIGSAEVIQKLVRIAPVTAVLGNMDESDYGFPFTKVGRLLLANMRILLMHDPAEIDVEVNQQATLAARDGSGVLPQIAVMGHTHIPDVQMQDGILRVNPGSTTRPLGGSRPGLMLMSIAGGIVSEIKRFEWDQPTAA